jgi:predicted secreted protein
MAYDIIKDKIPNIPNIFFIPPTIKFSFQTNIMINPFVNVAKVHLMGSSGIMSVVAQYPPPAPPAPAILNWNGYNVVG